MYYIKDWKQVERPNNSLVKFAHILSDRSGLGMIALQSATSDRYALSSDYASIFKLHPDVAGEELIEELLHLGIPHTSEIVESRLNIASCFNQGQFHPNEEGKHLLSFILRTSWDHLSKETQEHFKRMILSKVQVNGKEELIFRDCYIWISNCLKK